MSNVDESTLSGLYIEHIGINLKIAMVHRTGCRLFHDFAAELVF